MKSLGDFLKASEQKLCCGFASDPIYPSLLRPPDVQSTWVPASPSALLLFLCRLEVFIKVNIKLEKSELVQF